jgi:prepilin-type N-terminal cleavage/methylation domain-containing protein
VPGRKRLASQRRVLIEMRRPRVATRLSADERGFTLPELLVASVLSLVVIGAAVTAFTATIRTEPRVEAQAAGIQQAQTTMERIIRELRQGSTVPSASTSQLAIVTYVDGATCGTTTPLCRVTYTCTPTTSTTCTRTVAKPDGTSPGSPLRVVSGLSNNNIFTYTAPSSNGTASVGVTFAFPGEGGSKAITLTDSASLRNPSGT